MDGTALALVLVGAGLGDDVGKLLSGMAVTGYVLGGPVVHLAHENPGRALGSLALRTGLPLAFGYVGVQAESCDAENGELFCGFAGAVLGGLAGITTAIILDSAVLAREQVPAATERAASIGFFSDGQRTLLIAAGHF